MLAQVDKDICIGCGLCTSICGDVFQLEDDGKAFASNEEIENLMDDAVEAKDSCPVQAISIE